MAYTNIDDPSAYFQTKTYTGTNNSNALTNDGNSDLKPDFLWIKRRDYDNGHQLLDSTRGVDKILGSELTSAETTLANRLSSFDTDGFTVESSSGAFNASGEPFVAWQWKANGGTTASNSDGSVTSTVQVNQDAGFSIVTFDSASSGNFSVGHGLGVQPAMIITKNREGTGQWYTWHKDLTGGTSNTSYLLSLNRTDAEESYANAWGAGVTSSVFGMQSGNTATASNDYVAYCFNNVQGYSKFGKYVGNGASDASPNTNGPFIYTGFSPAFVIIKKTSAVDDWLIFDNKRAGYDPAVYRLYPNSSSAETSGTNNTIQFTSNGFKIRFHGGSMNTSGGTYIYMAFAENPFVTSTGIPTTAR